MASYTTKYAEDEAPAAPPPPEPAAKLPDSAVEKPKSIPEKAAAEISKRLAEMKRASDMAAAPPQPPEPQQSPPMAEPEPPLMAEPEDDDPVETAIRDWPERAKEWARLDPRIVNDQERNAEFHYLHQRAVRETGGVGDPYFDKMEQLLGFTREPPEPQQQPRRQAPSAPQRSSGYAAPVSAPPSREAPSMSNGRPPSDNNRIVLNADEQQIAWISRSRADMTRREANEEYALNKRRMQAMKSEGYQ